MARSFDSSWICIASWRWSSRSLLPCYLAFVFKHGPRWSWPFFAKLLNKTHWLCHHHHHHHLQKTSAESRIQLQPDSFFSPSTKNSAIYLHFFFKKETQGGCKRRSFWAYINLDDPWGPFGDPQTPDLPRLAYLTSEISITDEFTNEVDSGFSARLEVGSVIRSRWWQPEIPKNHRLGCKKKNLANNGINYQPQLVSLPDFWLVSTVWNPVVGPWNNCLKGVIWSWGYQ